MAEYYILIRPFRLPFEDQKATIYVKEGSYFRQQGGLTQDWGREWQLVDADCIEHARSIGYDQAGVKSYNRP